MAKKKSDRADTVFHTAPRKKTVVKPKVEPREDSDAFETVLWSEVAPDTFTPDKPDQELDQIMSYKDTHQKKPANKRSRGKRS